MTEQPLRILGLSGSIGRESKNSRLVLLALEKAEEMGAEIEFWDLVEKPLPLVGEEGCWQDTNVKEFQELASSCDAFVASSPEYHGTMSGVMKNTLDWVYKDHVGGKPFAVMSTLGGMANSNTLNHMRICLRWLHCWVIPEQLAVGNVKEAFDEDGKLADEEVEQRLSTLVSSLIDAGQRLTQVRE